MIAETRRHVKVAFTIGGEDLTYKEAREKAGLTQDEAAEKIGVSRVSIWLWETGRGSPLIANLGKMSEAYGIPISELDIEAATQRESRAEESKDGSADA